MGPKLCTVMLEMNMQYCEGTLFKTISIHEFCIEASSVNRKSYLDQIGDFALDSAAWF